MPSAETSAFLAAIFTGIYTVGTFMLWYSTKKTTNLLSKQLETQIAANKSTFHHSVVDAHRELFSYIVSDSDLLKIFANDSGLSEFDLKCKYIGSMLINHTSRMFFDYYNGIYDQSGKICFEQDARQLFSMHFIKKRWLEVRDLHPDVFKKFVETSLLPEDVIILHVKKPWWKFWV